MSQKGIESFQLSGEEQKVERVAYLLEKYLGSEGGVTERLLKGTSIGDIDARVQAVEADVEMLVRKIKQPPQTPT